MTPRQLQALDHELERFLAQLLGQVPRKDQRSHVKTYVLGLLLDGERKSVEPLASRLAPTGQAEALRQRLQHCLANSPWSDDLILQPLAWLLDKHLKDARYFIIDDTGQAKKGSHSVGVARQYSGTLGKEDNCQVHVSVHLASETTGSPLNARLYLPQCWTDDPGRCLAAGVPPEITFETKWELALDLLDEVLAWGVRPRVVLADAAYGDCNQFREGLRERQLPFTVAVRSTRVVWEAAHAPDDKLSQSQRLAHERSLPEEQQPKLVKKLALSRGRKACRQVTWREGSKGRLQSSFSMVRVRPAYRHGHGVRPEPEVTLLYEWPEGEPEPTGYWYSSLPMTKGLKKLVRVAKARWVVERNYQDEKEEVGLDHFEGRTWRGIHRHYTLCAVAHAFLALHRQHFPPEERAFTEPSPSPAAEDSSPLDWALPSVRSLGRRAPQPPAPRQSASQVEINVTR